MPLPRPEHIELPDPELIPILRRMTPQQRLDLVFQCNRTYRLRLAGHLQTRHPEWTAEEIQQEVARRMLHGAS